MDIPDDLFDEQLIGDFVDFENKSWENNVDSKLSGDNVQAVPCLLDITLASINETNSKRRKTLTPVKDAELEKHGQDASNLVTDVMSSVFGSVNNASDDSLNLLEEVISQAVKSEVAAATNKSDDRNSLNDNKPNPLDNSLIQFEALEYIAKTNVLLEEADNKKTKEPTPKKANADSLSNKNNKRLSNKATPNKTTNLVGKPKIGSESKFMKIGSISKARIPLTGSKLRSPLKISNPILVSDKKKSIQERDTVRSTLVKKPTPASASKLPKPNLSSAVKSRLPVPMSRLPVIKKK